jgi:hypothetical protein
MRPDGFGKLLTEIKVATDAFMVRTIEPEHGPRMIEVHVVFDLTAPGGAVGRVVGEIHPQGLQFRKPGSETGRVPDALAFQVTVFRARTDFVGTHKHEFRFF